MKENQQKNEKQQQQQRAQWNNGHSLTTNT